MRKKSGCWERSIVDRILLLKDHGISLRGMAPRIGWSYSTVTRVYNHHKK